MSFIEEMARDGKTGPTMRTALNQTPLERSGVKYRPQLTPEQLREELHLMAEQTAKMGRVQDTMALLKAAAAVRDSMPHLEGWVPLSKLETDQPPERIRNPDGHVMLVEHWVDILAATVEWLIKNDLLSAQDCPIVLGNSRVPLIQAQRPTRRPRQRSEDHRQVGNGLYLYVKFNRQEIRSNCQTLLWKCGINPDAFLIKRQQ